MAGEFDFCPNSLVPTLVPPEPIKGMSLNGWTFTSKPTIPYVRKFKVMLHGMQWFLGNDGLFDAVTNPTINAHRLELFYEQNQCWDSFIWNHPHLGELECRFDAPVQIPAAIPNSNGLIEPFEVNLIVHNPKRRKVTVPGSTVTLNALTLSANSYPENSPQSTLVATVSGMTSGSTLSLIMTSGQEGRLTISNGQIRVGAVNTDREATPTISGVIRETHPNAAAPGYRDTPFSFNITDVQVTITGTLPPATVGQPYGPVQLTVTGTGAISAPDATLLAALQARGFTYNGTTHTLSSNNVLPG